MKPDWTPQQLNAINARNRNILVSAAAGSGKTAVLVDRVKQMVTDSSNPVPLDSLLIVTFTNAAAAEMKSRISRAINDCIIKEPENLFYKKQLSLLPSAKICTIDSFCSNLVREYFYDLSIAQDFTVLDDSELQLMEDRIISDVIDDFFKNGSQDFVKLIEAFTKPGSDKELIETVKRLINYIYSQPFPYEWLDSALVKYNPNIPFEASIWYEHINNELNYLLSYGESLIKKNISLIDFEDDKLNEKFENCFYSDLAIYDMIKNATKESWDLLATLNIPSFSRIPYSKKADPVLYYQMKANRETYKNIIEKDISAFLISDTKSYYDDLKGLYSELSAMIELVKESDKRLSAEKKERNAYSFADIENFAIRLLFDVDTQGNIIKKPLAEEMSRHYSEILVDEYQDTNSAQDLLFTYLSNGKNLFTVGDIKQSIYRFRLAMPHIFNSRKKSYKLYDSTDNETSSKIILDRNFRSRKEICSYVNFIFSSIMTERTGELDYTEEEYLNCGAKYSDSDVPSAQINIIAGVKGEETDRKEATAIAKLIRKKIDSGELVKDGDSYRPVKYSDFAILMRNLKSHLNDFSAVLTEFGIPVVCDSTTNLFENNEIRIILSLLRTIDNPTQDIPLLATLISPIYAFSPDELAEIKINCRGKGLYKSLSQSNLEKAKSFIEDISSLRKISVTMSVSSFIRYIIEDKGIISYINAMGNAEQRYQNVLKLIDFALNFDNGTGVGLTAFMRYVDKIIESDKNVDSAVLGGNASEAVTIMSIHRSKGLEFPICILAGSSRRYNTRDLSNKLLINNEFGIGLKMHDEENLLQYKTIPYSVIHNKNSLEIMSENLRVLYVAITRAKEQFITFYTCDDVSKKLKSLASSAYDDGRLSPYTCSKISCDGDFILLCAMLHNDGELLRQLADCYITPVNANFPISVRIDEAEEITETTELIEYVPANEQTISLIENKLSFSYERMELQGLASMLSASNLDSFDRSFKYLATSKPSFMCKCNLSPAERGTAMHSFMEHCNYINSRNDIDCEIERLVSDGKISSVEAASLDRKKLVEFFSSEIAGRMFNADNIYRELKLTSFVKAKDVYDVDCEDNVLVQGIADCVFEENGQLILLDYKTDRAVSEDELLNRYKKQLMFYKNAIERTLKKPVKEVVLYSFYLGKLCYYK